MRSGLAVVLLLTVAQFASAADAFPPLPFVLVGANQGWAGDATKITDPAVPSWDLTDADLAHLKASGANTLRFPVYPVSLGLGMGTDLFSWQSGAVWDAAAADRLAVDWRLLDAILGQLARHGLTPYICPHPYPAQWQTIYVPEDAERTLWYTELIVRHVNEQFGGNVIYGWYENIWRNSLEPWGSGPMRHNLSSRFLEQWRAKLTAMYAGDIAALNRTWRTDYTTFAQVELPDLGTPMDVPPSAYANRRTYDLRLAVDLMSRDVLAAWQERLRGIAPGALWAGACQHGFYGMHDTLRGHQPKCNWSMATHARTGDFLAADSYEREGPLGVFWRTAAKIAAREGTPFAAVEVNGAGVRGLDVIRRASGPTRGALVWDARSADFGLIAADGGPREDRLAALQRFSAAMSGGAVSPYRAGRVHVYYPEETYEYTCLRRSHLDAYERVCDQLPPEDLEPVLTDDLDKLPPDVPVFVLERHLPHRAIVALNRLGRRVVSPHRTFVDESGTNVARSWRPPDFYAQLLSCPDGPALLDAFQRVEEKERDIATLDDGATALCDSSFVAEYGEFGINNLVDGDPVASRIMFADRQQPEVIHVRLPRPEYVDGAFLETAVEDPGRTPARVQVLVSTDGVTWTPVATATDIKADRVHLRFPATIASAVRFDLGTCTDAVGSRVMEVGVLGSN
jgi:hypothetical protein